MERLTVGTKIVIEKGSRGLELPKGVSGIVVEVQEQGVEYNHNVRVAVRITNGFKAGKVFQLYAIHPNRLEDPFVRLRNGWRTGDYIEVRRK